MSSSPGHLRSLTSNLITEGDEERRRGGSYVTKAGTDNLVSKKNVTSCIWGYQWLSGAKGEPAKDPLKSQCVCDSIIFHLI